ncbi:MAG: hypothetical protein PHF67_00225 [Candidatus Nanoarchaeia archaeon]|nr:hypothetical protein [Candidatus Nanoarchaeia archaeon]
MKYKILLINLGYFSGLNGSLFDYIFKSYRYIFPSRTAIKKIIENLKRIIYLEEPDIICIVEIRKNQIKALIDREYNFYDIETKYLPKSMARKIPILKNQSNAFISKKRMNFKKFFIKYGSKKLVYNIELPKKINLIFFHFALGEKTREKQFKDIREMANNREKSIICGDFNTFKGISEINPLIKNSCLELRQKNPTFPAFRPKKAFDIFITSKNLKTKSRVINSEVSDHLPVMLEIEL